MDCSLQASLSMGFPRQEYQSGLSFPSPEDLCDSGIKLESPKVAGRFFTTEPPGKPFYSALGAQSLSHWTTRVVPTTPLLSWGKCGLIPPVYSRVGARPSPSQSKYSLLLVSDWLRNEHVTLIRPMRVIPGKNYSCYSLSNFQVYQVVC